MFAIPEYSVLPSLDRYPLNPSAMIRWVTAAQWQDVLGHDLLGQGLLGGAARVALHYDDPRVRIWITVLPAGGDLPMVHRYEAAQGAFAVLSGVVVEEAGGTARTLRPGQARVFGPGYRHTVRADGSEPAVAVHVQIDTQPG